MYADSQPTEQLSKDAVNDVWIGFFEEAFRLQALARKRRAARESTVNEATAIGLPQVAQAVGEPAP